VQAEKPLSEGSETKKRATPKPWTQDEEKLFLEALELYGRDWKSAAEYLNHTRDHKGIASHAQKYFIKLYKEDIPLPAKVMESGEGYTLSGKPLDPNSAAARAYGLQGTLGKKSYRDLNAAKRESCSLKRLVDAGLVNPEGDGVSMSYKESTWKATVTKEGEIEHNGQTYQSPSAFSIALKRTVTPSKKADDGWRSVFYNGVSLENLKNKLHEETDVKVAKEKETVAVDEVVVDEVATDVDLSQLTARARNDALLAQMKSQGVKLNQVVDGTRNPPKESDENMQKKNDAQLRSKQERDLKKQQDAWEQQQLKRQKVYGEDGRTEYSRGRSRRKTATKYVTAPTEALQFVSTSTFQGPPVSGPRSQPFHVFVHSSVYATVDLHSHMSTAEVMGFLAGSWDASKLTINVVAAFPGRSMLDGATECEMDPVVEVDLRATIETQGMQVVGWYHSHPTFQPVPSSCDVDNQANYQALFHDGAAQMEPFIALINSPYDMRLPSSRSQFSWFYVESPQTMKSAKRIESQMVCDTTLSDTTMSIMEQLVNAKDASSCHAVDFKGIWRDDPNNGSVSFLQKLRTSLAYWLPPLVHATQIAQHEELGFIHDAQSKNRESNQEEIQCVTSFLEDKVLAKLI